MAVLAHELSRVAVFDALKARQFYATCDRNLALSFTIAGFEMGSTVVPGCWNVRIEAADDEHEVFSLVELIDENHNVAASWTPGSRTVDIDQTLAVAEGDFYYVRVTQADGDRAITSPIWVSGAQP